MALVVWITSGIFSMVGAYCYAELGCMIKKTGADYAYIMVALGDFLAFIRLWVECMIIRPCTVAIVALTFSIYAVKYFFPECDPPDEAVRILAAACICEWKLCSYFFNTSFTLILRAEEMFLQFEYEDKEHVVSTSLYRFILVHQVKKVHFYAVLSLEK